MTTGHSRVPVSCWATVWLMMAPWAIISSKLVICLVFCLHESFWSYETWIPVFVFCMWLKVVKYTLECPTAWCLGWSSAHWCCLMLTQYSNGALLTQIGSILTQWVFKCFLVCTLLCSIQSTHSHTQQHTKEALAWPSRAVWGPHWDGRNQGSNHQLCD